MSSAILRRPLRSLLRPRVVSGLMASNYQNGVHRTMATRSASALKRWSCSDKNLPDVDRIKHIHVYDFDNTLFASPVPNRQLWSGPSIGMLQGLDNFVTGGWWHDTSFLAATGEGLEKEEPRAWDGWWNESIVNLVELTMEQKDAVNVLLTGRNEAKFSDLIQRILRSKGLQFDMICLRPEIGPANQKFSSTMTFKQAFLEDLVCTYHNATEIRLYEDRPRHVTTFRNYLGSLNDNLVSSNPPVRNRIAFEVIQVAENATTLDPVTEAAEVQRMLNAHNDAFRNGTLPRGSKPYEIKRTIFYTGYLITPEDTKRLLQTTNLPTQDDHHNEIRTLANNILITTRTPCPEQVLSRVGGLGRVVRWRAVAIGSYENKIWAMKVEPVNPNERIYVEHMPPSIVLALKKSAKPYEANRIQQWQQLPDNKIFEFDATVGEKVFLRIEEEERPNNVAATSKPDGYKGNKRLRTEDFPPLGQAPSGAQSSSANGQQQTRSYHQHHESRHQNGPSSGNQRGGSQRNRGGSGPGVRGAPSGPRNNNNNQSRGGQGGGNARGRGRGGFGRPYRSLDDESGKGKGKEHGQYDGANDAGLMY